MGGWGGGFAGTLLALEESCSHHNVVQMPEIIIWLCCCCFFVLFPVSVVVCPLLTCMDRHSGTTVEKLEQD